MRKYIAVHGIFLCLVMACSPLCAQLPQDLKITRLDGTTGFYSRVVTAVLKDTKGFLWIGTSDGLYRYDGFSFRNYSKQAGDTNSLSDNYVTQLALGKDNKIWMGLLKGGVSSFDPATGQFSNYPLVYKGNPIAGSVTMLLVDHDNQVWLGIKQKGFWKLDLARREYQLFDVVSKHDGFIPKDLSQAFNTVSTGIEGKPGTLWLGTYNGLYRFDSRTKKLEAVRNKPLQQHEFRDDDFISIARDGDLLWLGAWAGGLSSYNTVTGKWNNYKLNQRETKKYTTNIVSGIRVRSADELWITSNDKGLGIFNKKTKRFSFYADDPLQHPGIPSNLCYEVETDKDNLWLIHEWGLTRIQPRKERFVFTGVPVTKTDNQQYYYVRDLLEDDSRIYIATTLADGLHVVDKKTGSKKQYAVQVMKGEEPFLAVYKLFRDSKGNIWVISRDYIYQFDTKQSKLVMLPQPSTYPIQHGSSQFNNIAEDGEGNIWICSSRNGVFRFDPRNKQYRHFYHDTAAAYSISSDMINAISTDQQGRIWIGGQEGCLASFNKQQNRFENIGLKKEAGFDDHVLSLFADRKGNLWVGSDNGVAQVDINTQPVLRKIYTAQDGLRGDQANAIVADNQGRVWCATPSALCMIDPATQRVNSVALQDDIIRSITNRVYLSLIDQKVQVLTYGGFYSFDPELFNERKETMPISITSFQVKDKEYYYEDGLEKNGRIELGPYENMFSFEFAVLDFTQSDDRRYAYMLEGFDKDWINTGNRRYASYTNIPGGKYTFRVKALNAYGDANSRETHIPVYVATAFYYSWWFLSLLAILVAYGLYWFYQFKLTKQAEILRLQSKAQALEKEKTQVQYENLKQHLNPHFLFNSLSSLGSLIRTNQKMAGDFLDGMSRIYRYILQSKDNETVSLKDELKFIEAFIQLQRTRFPEGLEFIIAVPEEWLQHRIVPVTLQNLLENAVKHNIIDPESPLRIEILVENGYLLVRNNLQRKKFVETSNKQGLENLLSLYKYLSSRKPMLVEEDEQYFTVKIPLL
jgi:ligand-binding sensor domain-containing protein